MSFIQNIFSSRDNNSDPTTYVGQQGRLWFDPVRNAFYSSDGSSPGGTLVGLAGAGSVAGANTEIQFNDNGIFGASANLTFSESAGLTTHIATIGNIRIADGIVSSIISNNDITMSTVGASNIHLDTNGFHIHTTSNPNPVFQVSPTGDVQLLTPVFNAADGAFSVVGSVDGVHVAPQLSGVMVHLTGQPSTPSRIYNDSANNYSAYVGRRYNNTSNAPTQVLSGDIISRIGATPYLATGWPAISTSRIDFKSTENQTANNQGVAIEFWSTANGTNTISRMFTISNNSVTFQDGTTQSTAGIPLSSAGNALGVATLDASAKVPLDQLPAGAVVYKGAWDASINSPVLADGAGTAGWQYSVSVGGTINLGSGAITWYAGDRAIFNGTIWQKISGVSGVVTFNARNGAVTLASGDVTSALGYTPYNGNTNPLGFVSVSQAATAAPVQSVFGRTGAVALVSSDVTTALTAGSLDNVKFANANVVLGNTILALGSTVANLTGMGTISTVTLNVTGVSNLDGVANVRILGGNAGQYLQTNGSGNLTWSSTGIGSGYYGSFVSTLSQLNAGATVVNPVTYNITELSNGITVTNASRITVANAGVYSIQFSLQFYKSDPGTDEAEVWLSKNGVNVINTNTYVQLIGDRRVAAWNFLVSAAANDYYELYWYSADTAMQLLTASASSNPSRPVIPSVILTIHSI